jgi:DNA-binding NtrC family response regulator
MGKPRVSDLSTECSTTRILLVENDENQRLLYREELEGEGYKVILAKNGKEALKCLEDCLCDLIILDILMPEMDGFEVLGKMVSRYKSVPVVLHTAYGYYKNEFISLLADAFVVKSSDFSILKKTIKELLERRKRLRKRSEKDSQTT